MICCLRVQGPRLLKGPLNLICRILQSNRGIMLQPEKETLTSWSRGQTPSRNRIQNITFPERKNKQAQHAKRTNQHSPQTTRKAARTGTCPVRHCASVKSDHFLARTMPLPWVPAGLHSKMELAMSQHEGSPFKNFPFPKETNLKPGAIIGHQRSMAPCMGLFGEPENEFWCPLPSFATEREFHKQRLTHFFPCCIL